MMTELKDKKDNMLLKREDLLKEYDETNDLQQKPYLLSKIRQIERELQSEFFKILVDRGEEIPTFPESKVPEMINTKHK